jgi:hypothetical protein
VQQEILPHEFTGQKPDPPKHQNKFKEKYNITISGQLSGSADNTPRLI